MKTKNNTTKKKFNKVKFNKIVSFIVAFAMVIGIVPSGFVEKAEAASFTLRFGAGTSWGENNTALAATKSISSNGPNSIEWTGNISGQGGVFGMRFYVDTVPAGMANVEITITSAVYNGGASVSTKGSQTTKKLSEINSGTGGQSGTGGSGSTDGSNGGWHFFSHNNNGPAWNVFPGSFNTAPSTSMIINFTVDGMATVPCVVCGEADINDCTCVCPECEKVGRLNCICCEVCERAPSRCICCDDCGGLVGTTCNCVCTVCENKPTESPGKHNCTCSELILKLDADQLNGGARTTTRAVIDDNGSYSITVSTPGDGEQNRVFRNLILSAVQIPKNVTVTTDKITVGTTDVGVAESTPPVSIAKKALNYWPGPVTSTRYLTTNASAYTTNWGWNSATEQGFRVNNGTVSSTSITINFTVSGFTCEICGEAPCICCVHEWDAGTVLPGDERTCTKVETTTFSCTKKDPFCDGSYPTSGGPAATKTQVTASAFGHTYTGANHCENTDCDRRGSGGCDTFRVAPGHAWLNNNCESAGGCTVSGCGALAGTHAWTDDCTTEECETKNCTFKNLGHDFPAGLCTSARKCDNCNTNTTATGGHTFPVPRDCEDGYDCTNTAVNCDFTVSATSHSWGGYMEDGDEHTKSCDDCTVTDTQPHEPKLTECTECDECGAALERSCEADDSCDGCKAACSHNWTVFTSNQTTCSRICTKCSVTGYTGQTHSSSRDMVNDCKVCDESGCTAVLVKTCDKNVGGGTCKDCIKICGERSDKLPNGGHVPTTADCLECEDCGTDDLIRTCSKTEDSCTGCIARCGGHDFTGVSWAPTVAQCIKKCTNCSDGLDTRPHENDFPDDCKECKHCGYDGLSRTCWPNGESVSCADCIAKCNDGDHNLNHDNWKSDGTDCTLKCEDCSAVPETHPTEPEHFDCTQCNKCDAVLDPTCTKDNTCQFHIDECAANTTGLHNPSSEDCTKCDDCSVHKNPENPRIPGSSHEPRQGPSADTCNKCENCDVDTLTLSCGDCDACNDCDNVVNHGDMNCKNSCTGANAFTGNICGFTGGVCFDPFSCCKDCDTHTGAGLCAHCDYCEDCPGYEDRPCCAGAGGCRNHVAKTENCQVCENENCPETSLPLSDTCKHIFSCAACIANCNGGDHNYHHIWTDGGDGKCFKVCEDCIIKEPETHNWDLDLNCKSCTRCTKDDGDERKCTAEESCEECINNCAHDWTSFTGNGIDCTKTCTNCSVKDYAGQTHTSTRDMVNDCKVCTEPGCGAVLAPTCSKPKCLDCINICFEDGGHTADFPDDCKLCEGCGVTLPRTCEADDSCDDCIEICVHEWKDWINAGTTCATACKKCSVTGKPEQIKPHTPDSDKCTECEDCKAVLSRSCTADDSCDGCIEACGNRPSGHNPDTDDCTKCLDCSATLPLCGVCEKCNPTTTTAEDTTTTPEETTTSGDAATTSGDETTTPEETTTSGDAATTSGDTTTTSEETTTSGDAATTSGDTTTTSEETTTSGDAATTSGDTTTTTEETTTSGDTTTSEPISTTSPAATTTPAVTTTPSGGGECTKVGGKACSLFDCADCNPGGTAHKLLGDTNGDDKVDIFDCLEILKFLIKMNSTITKGGDKVTVTQAEKAAIISPQGFKEGKPTIFCVLEILKYMIGMSSTEVKGNNIAPVPKT